MFKELQKQRFDKSQINACCSMLFCIWGNDVETIRTKLIMQVQDKFIWEDGITEYINLEVSKISN